MDLFFHGYGETPTKLKKPDPQFWKAMGENAKTPVQLDDVREPILTDGERRSPQYLRHLIVASKKCDSMQNWSLISREHLQKLLQYSENDVLPVSKLDGHKPAKFTYGVSFVDFHLQWHDQEPRSKLVRDWLTYHCRKNVLEDVNKEDEISGFQIGTYVAAKWIDDCWYRGFVKDIDKNRLLVYYVDQGNIESHDKSQLRLLPRELVSTPPMCFRAKLADIPNVSDEAALKYGSTQVKFLTKMRKNSVVQCRIDNFIGLDYDFTPGVGKALVYLQFQQIIPKILPGSRMESNSINIFVRNSLAQGIQMDYNLEMPLPEEVLNTQAVPPGVTIASKSLPASPLFYKISHVINPSLVYVKIANKTDVADSSLNNSKLQDFYSNSGCRELDPFKIRTQRLYVNRPYVWLDMCTNIYYRVVVCRVDAPPGKSYVFRVDVGDHLLVSENDMMEIKPEFTRWPCLAVKAHLVHIQPMEEEICWNESAIAALRNISESCSNFRGIPVEQKETNECAHNKISYGMLLIDTSFRSGYSIQARLTSMGIVRPSEFLTGNNHLAFLCYEGIPVYDRQKMVEQVTAKESSEFTAILHFSTETRRPNHRFSDIIQPSQVESTYLRDQAIFKGHAEVQPLYEQKGKRGGISCCLEDSCKIDCKYWQNKRSCFPTLEPTFRYLKRVGYNPVTADIVTSVGPLTTIFGDYLGAVRISHADGPGVFYIQMANKVKELEEMMVDIGELVKDSSVVENDCKGSLVAALVYSDELIPNWHRAYVTNVIGSICKVILIDVGSRINVPLKNVRNLPEYFWCIPLFCRRAHLDVGSNCLRNCKWTSKLNQIFISFLQFNLRSVYLAWKPHPESGDVEVIDYGQVYENSLVFHTAPLQSRLVEANLVFVFQDVCFDNDKKQWWNGGNIPSDFPVVLQSDYDKKLLYHLLHSIGINIRWESASFNPTAGEFFHFEEIEKLFL